MYTIYINEQNFCIFHISYFNHTHIIRRIEKMRLIFYWTLYFLPEYISKLLPNLGLKFFVMKNVKFSKMLENV